MRHGLSGHLRIENQRHSRLGCCRHSATEACCYCRLTTLSLEQISVLCPCTCCAFRQYQTLIMETDSDHTSGSLAFFLLRPARCMSVVDQTASQIVEESWGRLLRPLYRDRSSVSVSSERSANKVKHEGAEGQALILGRQSETLYGRGCANAGTLSNR